ncbi:MAG: hypothetical protein LW710_00305 [Burkholderiales bacterium]|jgi:hypothetical protein|uniref:hypothetical protein n=1 Tax=Limnobacter sp. TaxID=2003368 RepID=UPI0039561A83|nr:hypothetical protein [Burkholderiales bacterium]
MFQQRSRYHSLSFDTGRKQGSFLRKASRVLSLIFGLMIATALTLFGISSCQDKAEAQQVLSYASKNNCEFRFEGVGHTLIENHCGKNAGVYFMTPQGLHTAPLFDPEVSALLNKHGCEAPNQCAFNLEMKPRVISGQFDYTINGKQGFYSFEWPRDEQPRLVETSSTPDKS